MSRWHLWARVLLPFAAGYYLSYVFRTINGLIAGDLAADIGLSPPDLGLLTSVYFLMMAVVQWPFGVMLDRYGPRSVQSICLVGAAAGAILFATSETLAGLVFGRAVMGVGFAVALMAGLKAIVLWFPSKRIAGANGLLVTAGAFGAVTATWPMQMAVNTVGWRDLVLVLAAVTLGAAAIMFLAVPRHVVRKRHPAKQFAITLRAIYTDQRFFRLAPLSAACVGSAWAMHGPKRAGRRTQSHRRGTNKPSTPRVPNWPGP